MLAGSPPGGFVLDPFVGSGTTLEVATELGRHSVGVDLSYDYTTEVVRRLREDGGKRASWDSLIRTLGEEPSGWDGWPGNRRLFRKPGSAKD